MSKRGVQEINKEILGGGDVKRRPSLVTHFIVGAEVSLHFRTDGRPVAGAFISDRVVAVEGGPTLSHCALICGESGAFHRLTGVRRHDADSDEETEAFDPKQLTCTLHVLPAPVGPLSGKLPFKLRGLTVRDRTSGELPVKVLKVSRTSYAQRIRVGGRDYVQPRLVHEALGFRLFATPDAESDDETLSSEPEEASWPVYDLS